MSLDKILHKIQGQINDIAPTLELFVDDTIQPSVNDCEILQQQLIALQENLAVYKYNKLNKELSPSFNIHAKISAVEKVEEKKPEEKVAPIEKVIAPAPQVKEPVELEENIKEEPVEAAPIEPVRMEPGRSEPAKPRAPLSIGLNDKFRFINELFSQNAPEYSIAIEQLSNLTTWQDAEVYLNSLKSLYDWRDNHDVVKYFYTIAKKRFD